MEVGAFGGLITLAHSLILKWLPCPSGERHPLLCINFKDWACPVRYQKLQKEHAKVLNAFVGGGNIFAALPTGYGKSFCFTLLLLISRMACAAALDNLQCSQMAALGQLSARWQLC